MEKKQKAHNRYYAALVLIAFAFNLLLPSISAANYSSKQASAAQMILICSADGMKWISWDDLQSGEENPEILHQLQLPATAAAKALKDFANLEIIDISLAILTYKNFENAQATQFFQFSKLISGLNSRAPPVLS